MADECRPCLRRGYIGLMFGGERSIEGGAVVGVIPGNCTFRRSATRSSTTNCLSSKHDDKCEMYRRADDSSRARRIGTSKRFWKIFTWQKLRYHTKPVAILNTRLLHACSLPSTQLRRRVHQICRHGVPARRRRPCASVATDGNAGRSLAGKNHLAEIAGPSCGLSADVAIYWSNEISTAEVH